MSLAALQRDFRSWLTTEAMDAGARIGPSAAPGLAVYLNNYRGQLMACLADSFAVTRAWLGDAAFDGAAARHIDGTPPHSWTLDAYAEGFPEALALSYPDDREVPDLARLELQLGTAFVGPDSAALDPATLGGLDWDRACFSFVGSLEVLPLGSNAAAIWAAISAGETPPPALVFDDAIDVAVWRQGLSPTFRSLDRVEADALNAAREGQTFGAICARIAALAGEEEGPAVAGRLLGQWIGEGLLEAVHN